MTTYILPFITLINEMSPYLLLGFILAGFLKVFVPKDKYLKQISKPNISSVLLATFAGIPLPLCSCGVLPTGISLNKEGASNGATISFLTSTPQINVNNIIATYSLLGLPFAIVRPIAAVISSLAGGIIANKFGKQNVIEESQKQCEGTNNKSKNKIYQILHYSFVEMQQDIGKWLIIGIFFAGLVAIFLPDELFSVYLNNPLLNMLIVLLIALPMYTCTISAIPMAAVFLMKGISPGAAFVFLMAGPVTSIATMTVVGKTLGKRTLIIYLCNIIFNVLLFGLIIDYLLPASWFSMSIINQHILCESSGFELSIFKIICSIVFIGIIINAYIQKAIATKKKPVKCCCENNENKDK